MKDCDNAKKKETLQRQIKRYSGKLV